MKRDKIDAVFSTLVRERSNWTCESCGKQYPEGNRQGLHCSHFFGRRHQTLRHDPLNAAAHCFSCHQYLGENPVIFNQWIEDHIGVGAVEILIEKKNSMLKRTKADKEDLYKHLKKELKAMEEKRANGDDGRIEFEAFW